MVRSSKLVHHPFLLVIVTESHGLSHPVLTVTICPEATVADLLELFAQDSKTFDEVGPPLNILILSRIFGLTKLNDAEVSLGPLNEIDLVGNCNQGADRNQLLEPQSITPEGNCPFNDLFWKSKP